MADSILGPIEKLDAKVVRLGGELLPSRRDAATLALYGQLAAVVEAAEPLGKRLEVIRDAVEHELDEEAPLREGHVHAHQLVEELVLSGLIQAHAAALSALRARVRELTGGSDGD